jgi:hypothetical protein
MAIGEIIVIGGLLGVSLVLAVFFEVACQNAS